MDDSLMEDNITPFSIIEEQILTSFSPIDYHFFDNFHDLVVCAMHHFYVVDTSIEKMARILNVLFSHYEETCKLTCDCITEQFKVGI